ncbi:uncharacterized protein [Watersipora subatra]|uniref:uncharacterized protein n=1 Tax=Watersipora subatra TaxID=2589382 RepID=UPI00355AEC62
MVGKTILSITLLLWIGIHTTPGKIGQAALASGSDVLGAFSSFLSIGTEVTSAVAKFVHWADNNRGSVMITIENSFNNTNLGNVGYHVVAGSVDEIQFDVKGGEKEAVTVVGPQTGQTEGLIGWNLPNSSFKIAIYWRVSHKLLPAKRKPNKLGIGFVKSSTDDKDWLKNLAGKGKDLSISSIGMQEYVKGGSTMQCCLGEICLQGLMTSGHHCKVIIRVLPKKADRLFMRVNGLEEDQKFLDQVLSNPETCTSGAAAQVVSIGFVMLALTTILLG